MKEIFTKFKCDTCGKETTIVDGQGFPYELGWEYMYKFNGNTPFSDVEKESGHYDEEDKHFCGKECMFRFIEQTVNLAGGIGKPKVEEVAKEVMEEETLFNSEEVLEPKPIKQTKLSNYDLEQKKLERAKAITNNEVPEPIGDVPKPPKKGILQEVEEEMNTEKEQKPVDSNDSVLSELGIEK